MEDVGVPELLGICTSVALASMGVQSASALPDLCQKSELIHTISAFASE